MRFWPAIFLLLCTITTTPLLAQPNSPIAPVIIFVHGWCGTADGWSDFEKSVSEQLYEQFPKLYPSPEARLSYAAFYSNKVYFQRILPTPDYAGDSIDPSARFIRVAFVPDDYAGPDYTEFSEQGVAEISIVSKALELAKIIEAVRKQTNIRPVILVTHSMGGVVARAFLEDVNAVFERAPLSGGDTSLLLQLDTPNQPLGLGVDALGFFIGTYLPQFTACVQRSFQPTVNFLELVGTTPTIKDQINAPSALARYPSKTPLKSLVNIAQPECGIYCSPLYQAIETLSGEWSDGIVPRSIQDITSLTGGFPPTYESFTVTISELECPLGVHLLGCLVNQDVIRNEVDYFVNEAAKNTSATLKILPPNRRLYVNGQYVFNEQVTKLTDPTITWTVTPSDTAQIDGDGSFTASAPGFYDVVATSTPFSAGELQGLTLKDTVRVKVESPTVPGFGLSVSPRIAASIQGEAVIFNITVHSDLHFSAPVSLSAWQLPPGGSNMIAPQVVTPPPDGVISSTLTVITSSVTPAGPYRIRIRATAQGFPTQEQYVSLTVKRPTLDSIWPMSGHDPQRTGHSSLTGPATTPGTPAWTVLTGAPIAGDIAVSAEGNIYFASDKLYAYKPDGTPLAPPVSLPYPAVSGPAIDDLNGYVYVGAFDQVNSWAVLRIDKSLQTSTIVSHATGPNHLLHGLISNDSTTYFQDFDGLHAAGKRNWNQPLREHCNGHFGDIPTIAYNGDVYLACNALDQSGGLYRFDAQTGMLLSNTTVCAGTEIMEDPTRTLWFGKFNANGFGCYGSMDERLKLLSFDNNDQTSSRSTLLADKTSRVKIGYAFNSAAILVAEGNVSWQVPSNDDQKFVSVPTSDAANHVYVGLQGGVACLDGATGNTLWTLALNDQILTQPVVSAPGSLVVGGQSGRVYFWDTGHANPNERQRGESTDRKTSNQRQSQQRQRGRDSAQGHVSPF